MTGVWVDAETHNSNLKRFADELIEKYKDGELLKKAFPGKLGPTIGGMAPKPAKDRLAWYTMITDPADFGLLMDSFYVRKYRRGWLPAPVTPHWRNLLALPFAFELYRADFESLYRRMVQQATATQ